MFGRAALARTLEKRGSQTVNETTKASMTNSIICVGKWIQYGLGRLWKSGNGSESTHVRRNLPGQNTVTSGDRNLPLTAYCTSERELPIVVAPAKRKWMDETDAGFANRCLPLRIANQAGWFILNDRRIEAVWNGGARLPDITIRYYKKSPSEKISPQQVHVTSHFGSGILTWHIPYLFRTPAGYNLYVRGPSNWCKDGVCPLDGLVETEWAVATFTMNWKITRVDTPILFEEGEPICMIFPQRRGDLSQFQPEIRLLDDAHDLHRRFQEWSQSRSRFIKETLIAGPDAKPLWQKHYFQGRSPSGDYFPMHQTGLKLSEFKDLRIQS